MRRLCIFCGSNSGSNPAYLDAAQALGRALATDGVGVVYGGASVGLMGAVADAALAAGGRSSALSAGASRQGDRASRIGDLRVVGSMHERKATMAEIVGWFRGAPAASARSRKCSRSGPGGNLASTPSPVRWSTLPASTIEAHRLSG